MKDNDLVLVFYMWILFVEEVIFSPMYV
jgi:hypothetical protein